MTETPERKAELDALRLELARELCRIQQDGDVMRLSRDGKTLATIPWPTTAPFEKLVERAVEIGSFPDVVRDDGAALRLALDISKQHDLNGVHIEDFGADGAWCCYPRVLAHGEWHHQAEGATPAEALARLALARLALAALRGGRDVFIGTHADGCPQIRQDTPQND